MAKVQSKTIDIEAESKADRAAVNRAVDAPVAKADRLAQDASAEAAKQKDANAEVVSDENVIRSNDAKKVAEQKKKEAARAERSVRKEKEATEGIDLITGQPTQFVDKRLRAKRQPWQPPFTDNPQIIAERENALKEIGRLMGVLRRTALGLTQEEFDEWLRRSIFADRA